MKKLSEDIIYYKKDTKETALVRHIFIYEVCINLYYKNYFSQIKNEIYSSPKPINFVPNVFINKHTQITCELYAAPLDWLVDNNFKIWVKPEKPKRICKNALKK